MFASIDPRPNCRAVAAAFGLKGNLGQLQPVEGGWSNRVFRLTVGAEAFVLKEMRNPWNLSYWREWLDEAWSFELAAIGAGVSAPEPIPSARDGGCLTSIERDDGSECDVRVHRWVDATRPAVGPASSALAAWVGATLATLHRLDIRPGNRANFPTPNVVNAERWPALVEAAVRSKAPWAAEARAASTAVADIAKLALEEGDECDLQTITHSDIRQKNILLGASSPLLCDWDVASPCVPRREVADVALAFGAWERFDIAREVIAAYRAAGGELDRLTTHDLARSLMIEVDWTALNLERALRLRPVTDHEAALGASLVPELLSQLPLRLAVAMRVDEQLKI